MFNSASLNAVDCQAECLSVFNHGFTIKTTEHPEQVCPCISERTRWCAASLYAWRDRQVKGGTYAPSANDFLQASGVTKMKGKINIWFWAHSYLVIFVIMDDFHAVAALSDTGAHKRRGEFKNTHGFIHESGSESLLDMFISALALLWVFID